MLQVVCCTMCNLKLGYVPGISGLANASSKCSDAVYVTANVLSTPVLTTQTRTAVLTATTMKQSHTFCGLVTTTLTPDKSCFYTLRATAFVPITMQTC